MRRDAEGASATEERLAEATTAGDPDVTETTTADTFTLLSDEIRVGIVRELAAASEESLGFSDLRTRVGVRDGGRFNYHLQRLCGRLVEKTDDGYALTADGERAARLL